MRNKGFLEWFFGFRPTPTPKWINKDNPFGLDALSFTILLFLFGFICVIVLATAISLLDISGF